MATRPWNPGDEGFGSSWAWYDPSDEDTVTTDGSGNIEAIADKSGNDYHAANPIGSARFALVPDIINGKAIMRAPGANAGLNFNGANDDTVVPWGGTKTMFMLFAWRTPNSTYEHLMASAGAYHGFNSTSPVGPVFQSLGTQKGYNATWTINGSDTTTAGSALLKSPVFKFYQMELQAVDDELFGWGYGSSSLSSRSPSVDYGETLLFNETPTPEQIEKIEGYLAWKYGLEGDLPSGHTYKAGPPTVEESGGIFVPWTPDDDSPLLWLEAWDESSRTLSGAQVTGWTNKGVGEQGEYAQTVAADRPTWEAGAVGGKDAFLFDGSNDVLEANFTPPESFITISIAKQIGQTSGGSILRPVIGCSAANANDGIFSVSCERAGERMDFAMGATRVPFVTDSWLEDETVLLSTEYDGTTLTGYKNGSALGSIAVAPQGLGPMHIGGDPTDAINKRRFKGYISAVVVVPISADREKYEGYFAHALGLQASLPSSHPYKDQPPGENIGEGGQVTGTVTISGQPAARDLIAITYAKQTIIPAEGEPFDQRTIVGETTSAEDGTYTLSTGSFLDEVIVLALEDYGTEWKPNRTLEVGDRIRPTQPNQNGYVYEVTIAGNSGTDEPTWIIPTGAVTTMSVGTATVQGFPLFWSLAHAPILPESTGPAVPTDPLWNSVALLLPLSDDILDVGPDAITVTSDGGAAVSGGRLVLDGIDDNIGAGIATNWKFLHDATDFTAELFFELDSVGEYQSLLDTGLGTHRVGFHLRVDNGNNLNVFVAKGDSNGYAASIVGTTTLATGGEHHVSVNCVAGVITLFLDGAEEGSATLNAASNSDPSNTLYVGRRGLDANAKFHGKIRGVRITTPDVRYTEAYTPPEPPFPTQGP